jgi:HEPN domain-containing protein
MFHMQQAVEKALKAVIIARGHTPPFVHSIETLAAVLEEEGPVPREIVDAADLMMEAYVDSRYDPWGDDPTESDVELGEAVALRALEWAKDAIERVDS